MTILAAAYIRTFSDALDYQTQEALVHQYAMRQNMELAYVYTDEGSGCSQQSPGLLQMESQALMGCFDVLIALCPEQLLNDSKKAQDYVTRLEQATDIQVVFVESALEGVLE